MFDSVLLPLDGSQLAECVLAHAVAIGHTFNSRVTVLQMMENQTRPGSRARPLDMLNWQINKSQSQLYLENIRDRLEKQGLRVESQVQEGRVAEGIVVFAEKQGVKLIILSSHGRGGLSYWGISSVTQKVILSAPTSVLLVRAHESAPGDEASSQVYRRILVPLDGSRRAENVLSVIERLARAQKAELHIAHVVTAPEMARHLPPLREDIDLSNRIVTRNRDEAQRYLERLTQGSSFEGIAVQTHLLTSENAAAALHELADEQQVDLLVLSAHGYSGQHDWPYGSVVSNFIAYGKSPLLVVQDLPARHELSVDNLATRERSEH